MAKESEKDWQGDPNRLLRLKDVLALVPVSASTWWDWVARSKAPKPVRIAGTRCTFWRYDEVASLAEKVG